MPLTNFWNLFARILVVTLVTAGRMASADFPDNYFTHVFIDEAGHAQEPEAVIAVAGDLTSMIIRMFSDALKLVSIELY